MGNKQTQHNDFSEPRRMSKSAYVVLWVNEIKKESSFFFLIVFLEIFQSDKGTSLLTQIGKIALILLIVLTLASIAAFIDYYFKKFYVKNGNLVFMHGFIHREVTNIPTDKIHSMRTKSGLFYRMLDMKGVSFDTLASKEKEIELILDDADWDALLNKVETQDQVSETSTLTSQVEDIDNELNSAAKHEDLKETSPNNKQADVQKLAYSNLNLIKGALCQNHLRGMAVLGGAIVAIYSQISSVSDEAISYAFDYVEEHASHLSYSLTTILTGIFALYLVVMILWIGNVFLRYFNLDVRMNAKNIFFEGGLFTRQSSQFSYDKVCTVYVKQNIIEKWLNCYTLMLKQAFNATDSKNESDVKIYGSNSAGNFLNWWLGKDFASSQEICSAHSGNGVLGYTIRKDLVIVLIISAILCFFEQYMWLIAPGAYLLISLIKGLCATHKSCITLKEDYMVINTGQFADIRNFVKYNNIEVVRMSRTPFTPIFHRVILTIATNGTTFVVRSLKEEEAKEIYEILLHLCRERNEEA